MTAKQVPHAITNHMITVKLAAVLGPPQHRRMHLLQSLLNCRPSANVQGLHLCYMVHIKQGSKRLSPLNAKSLTHDFAFALLCWLARRWKTEHALRETARSQAPSPNHQRHAQPCNQMLSL
jgi:hypothetical protein